MALDRNALMAQADQLVAKGQAEKALAEYKKLLDAYPSDPMLLNRVGDIAVEAGQIKAGVLAFRALARIFQQSQQERKAVAMLKRVMKLAPDDMDAAHQLAEILAATGSVREAAQVHFQMADQLKAAGRGEESLAAFARGVAADPGRLDLRLQLAARYEEAGQKEKAAGAYQDAAEALAVDHREPEALEALSRAEALGASARVTLSRARILGIMGRKDEALGALEKALEAHPGNPTLIEAIAEQLIQTGHPEEGILKLRTLRQPTDRILPLSEQALHDLAEKGQLRLALRVFRPLAHDMAEKGYGAAVLSTLKIGLKGFQHPVLWMLRAEVAQRAEDKEEALLAMRQACSLSIERRSGILTRIIQQKLKELEGEEKNLGQIVTEQASQRTMMVPVFSRQQRDPKVKMQLDQMEKDAGSQTQLGNPTGAINLFLQVLSMDPGRYTAIHSLVQAYFHSGQLPKATAQCAKSAEVLCNMGRKQEARQILDLADQHLPGSTRAQRRMLGLD